MKLNCDLGESFGAWKMGMDEQVMPHIHMANIACGFHASDPVVMEETLQLAVQHGVEVGAHPGYPDLSGFGRRSMQCSKAEIRGILLYQISALSGMAQVCGAEVGYVKPHGALYNDMMRDDALMTHILETVADFDQGLKLVVQATSRNDFYRKLAAEHGIELLFEVFADRAYDDDGLLLPRSKPGAVFHDKNAILSRIEQLQKDGCVTSVSGKQIKLEPDTLCVHGDNEQSVQLVSDIRKAVDEISN